MPNRGSIHKTGKGGKAAKTENPRLRALRKRVAAATTEPGIYRWLDEKGDVLYVGKAKNLRNRLRSYVNPQPGADIGPWRRAFLELIADVDMTVTNSELEALILETNLIKELKPKYNVLMKDDKNYLFVRVAVTDAWPRVELVRRMNDDKARYFGPYLSSEEARETLELLHEALGYRACRQSLDLLNANRDPLTVMRPCLDHQIGRCCGTCAGAITREEYGERIARLMEYLRGDRSHVRAILEQHMKTAAAERKFEMAARLRNHLQRLEGKREEQIATDTTGEDGDIVGVAMLSGRVHVVVLHRREGRLIGESHFALMGQADSAGDVLEQFLPQFYDDAQDIPGTVTVSENPGDRAVLEEWLTTKRGGRVHLAVPERGKKSHLLQLAEKNALEKARQHEAKWESEQDNIKRALEGLQERLKLDGLPQRIEGYDISHLDGTETVGSMVVIRGGKPANDHYRSFTIRSIKRGDIDDYRALKEVLRRRLRHICEDLPEEERRWKDRGVTFGKARKAEKDTLETLDAEAAAGKKGITTAEYLVARQEGRIVGFGRMTDLGGQAMELRRLWTDEEYAQGPLGRFIARKLQRSVKKGKMYAIIEPAFELTYADIGFRYVIKPPKALQPSLKAFARSHDGEPVAVMYEASQNKVDPSLSSRPDLLVIDGGKGQLNAVLEVLKDCGLTLPVIGLAKREEEVFVPDNPVPIPFPDDSPAKFLLMRLRDEAHRFANRHREKRGLRHAVSSAIDDIPGIGEQTKKDLLRRFGTLSGVREATDEQLSEILTDAQLQSLRATLRG